jgi:hypothetical protein
MTKRNCAICGTEFSVTPSRLNTAKWCSKICAGLGRQGEKHNWTPWPKGKKRGPPTDVHRLKNAIARIGKPIHSEEAKKRISNRCRYAFTGGQAAIEFAKILIPAGYIREHHILWGERNERFVLDFAHLDAKVAFELDGTSHKKTQEYDELRDAWLKRKGWKVIRIKLWN